ncbi:hypothetical protein V2G26_019440 [Clonostachys chloroleuca]
MNHKAIAAQRRETRANNIGLLDLIRVVERGIRLKRPSLVETRDRCSIYPSIVTSDRCEPDLPCHRMSSHHHRIGLGAFVPMEDTTS